MSNLLITAIVFQFWNAPTVLRAFGGRGDDHPNNIEMIHMGLHNGTISIVELPEWVLTEYGMAEHFDETLPCDGLLAPKDCPEEYHIPFNPLPNWL